MIRNNHQYPLKGYIPEINYKKHPIYQQKGNKSSFPFALFFIFFKAYFNICKAFLKGKFLSLTTNKVFRSSYNSKQLDSDGICLIKLPNQTILNINIDYSSEIQRLKAKRKTHKAEKRGVINSITMLCSEENKNTNYDYFNNLSKEYGILDAVEKHKNMPMKLKFVALQINDSTDKGIEKSCRDRYGNLSRTKYMHIDSGVNTMKFLLYLNLGIAKGKGSFSFVLGSHKNHSFHKLVSRKVNDVINLESAKKDSIIAKFSSLPKALQYKANFGNDLNESQHKGIINILLENEIFVESSSSTGCIFNPDGIHRGSFFEEKGERIMLQFMYVPCF